MECSRRPNILILLADQHRAESLGCYGNAQVRSPHLDRMADEGLRFTHCVSNHPENDPHDLDNLINSPDHREVLQHLHARLTQRLTDAADPFAAEVGG